MEKYLFILFIVFSCNSNSKKSIDLNKNTHQEREIKNDKELREKKSSNKKIINYDRSDICDSIYFKNIKIQEFPDSTLINILKKRNLKRLREKLDENFSFSNEENVNRDTFLNKCPDNIWNFFDTYLSLEGTFTNDSTYVLPAAALEYQESCIDDSFTTKILVVEKTYLYQNEDFNSKKILPIAKNNIFKVLKADYNDIGDYCILLPNKETWYKVEYKNQKGYLNGQYLIELFNYIIFFTENSENEWEITEIEFFD